MVQLYARCMIPPAHYRLYRFYERDKDYRYMLNFLSTDAQKNRVQARLNDPSWKAVLDNKWLFHLYYQHFGLPLPEVYGIYEPGSGMLCSGQSLASADQLRAWLLECRPPALVAKPLGGIMGKQVLILSELHYQGDTISATTNTGQHMSFDELTALLDQQPEVRYYMNGGYQLNLTGYLLQEKVRQHPFLNELAPTTTNTVRIVTLLDGRGDIDIQFAILRLGRRGNMADNWDRGGISVAIDKRTGTLGTGVLKPKYGGQWVEAHPDTGARFGGRVLPYWHEVIELCTRAAQVTPKVRSIGWDVSITPDGPVLIEGNPDWDLAMVQVHTNGLLQPEARAKLAEFGLDFPQGELPRLSVRAWLTRLREQHRDNNFMYPNESAMRRLIVAYLREAKHMILP